MPARPESGAAMTFSAWKQRWSDLAAFAGPRLVDHEHRMREIVHLWKLPIPGVWKRDIDGQLLGKRYRRGDEEQPHCGEHAIEHQILCDFFPDVAVLGGQLVDGIDAMPLVADEAGARGNNVEADLFLLVRKSTEFRLILAEVKNRANHAW